MPFACHTQKHPIQGRFFEFLAGGEEKRLRIWQHALEERVKNKYFILRKSVIY